VPMADITRNAGRGDEGVRDLTRRIMDGWLPDVKDTLFYADWRKRKPNWSERVLLDFCQGKYNVVRDLVELGPKDPILVTGDNLRLCDGGHRAIVLEEMGCESAIVRKV